MKEFASYKSCWGQKHLVPSTQVNYILIVRVFWDPGGTTGTPHLWINPKASLLLGYPASVVCVLQFSQKNLIWHSKGKEHWCPILWGPEHKALKMSIILFLLVSFHPCMVFIFLISIAFHLKYLLFVFYCCSMSCFFFSFVISFFFFFSLFIPFSFSLAFEKWQCSLLMHSIGLSTFHHMENVKHAVWSCCSSYLLLG